MKEPLWHVLCLVSVCVAGCAKKQPRPLRTEPWLAHPTSSTAAAGSDAAPAVARYALSEQSRIRFELPSKHGSLRGTLSRVSGELSLNLEDLAHSHGQVRADLESLSLQGPDEHRDLELLARAWSALDLSEVGAAASQFASFELTSLEDLSPAKLEPRPERDASATFTRRVLSTAVGDLLLHGFRVVRRAPLTAEFSFVGDHQVPSSLVIRSRTPFVISLQTHAIRVPEGEPLGAGHRALQASARAAHVSLELYLKKED